MTSRNRKRRAAKPSGRQSVFQEAWENMNADFDRLLPERLRKADKKKFALWLFIVELLVLGLVGRFVYRWWVGG
ncbi:hypothetical protein EDC39_102172 [Geothermobacter ehrlichii]|uniref:Uncharacterized protein n=1 Tax=Geothermobacter ehrlichii TaxID=213224 RepID=A0A5D3WKV1_9BACT|nr:hypothetical protein [Geothermobacter ehrlichii]TYO99647.1 hypothetical protein EDC39_102172 [Geothermobacter ehrlichii]